MKKDQYFNLEVNLLNDDNIASMMSEMNAAEALGIYVILLLHLRTKDAYEASCKPVFPPSGFEIPKTPPYTLLQIKNLRGNIFNFTVSR